MLRTYKKNIGFKCVSYNKVYNLLREGQVLMGKSVKRGYVPEDQKEFTGVQLAKLQAAAKEVQYLLDHGYPVKNTTTFIGNHYMLSERQRLALARGISSKKDIQLRKDKQILQDTAGMSVHIDGFNTIISLEIALSGSLLLHCSDGTIRDLAGLRGTYRIIDKTRQAIRLVFEQLQELKIAEATFYLDAPVSNSGRLKTLILQVAQEYELNVFVEVIYDVDRVLEKLSGVISGDAIILNQCKSWINLVYSIVQKLPDIWSVQLLEDIESTTNA